MKYVLITAFIFPLALFGQQSALDSIDRFVAKQVVDFNVPGLVIGVIKEAKVIFKKGYGINSTVDSLPVDTQTLFPILSCTKAFTAAAVGILVDRGKLHWDDKVVQHLPNFKLSDSTVTKELTIGDILSHRSGLETFEGDLLWYGTNYSQQEVVRRIQYSPLRYKFRSQFGYQNVMYLLAGLIIESVTGQSWDEFIKKEVLAPLSMNRTLTDYAALGNENNYAHPHIQNRPIAPVSMDNIAPAGAVISTIDDLLRWMDVWIKGGTPLLSKSAFGIITKEKIKVAEGGKEGYGYGWFVEKKEGIKVLSHSGGMPGYKSFIIIIPERQIGVAVLTNKVTYINEQLAGVIIDHLLGKETNWQEADQLHGENFRFSWDEPRDTIQSHATADWSRYAGVYEDKSYGKAEITVETNHAILTMLPAKQLLTGRLHYVNKDTLKIAFTDPFISAGEVHFYKNADGKVKGFKFHIESSDFHFKYLDFLKKEGREGMATKHP